MSQSAENDTRHFCEDPSHPHVWQPNGWICVTGHMFTADEVVEIANETSDSLGNLYRVDFIRRIEHEARVIPPVKGDR
ncbi:hypothetical protein [Nocardioides terrigena]|uniref:hypothetical protein n=1 Tax=Nocardioides terrigena TaxID=424797 RepID=UPI000D30F48A|nr:hypothetical protein [Nocardioides terrigena]